MTQLQWFPGHMAKTIKILKQQINSIDILIELRDARIPLASQNPVISSLLNPNHHHIIGLTKTDLANPKQTQNWLHYFQEKPNHVLPINCFNQTDIKHLLRVCKQIANQNKKNKRFYITKVMICGIPNVGKSELINKLANKRATAVKNKPGVTKKTKGVMIDLFLELIDTPGILWPKIDDPNNAIKLSLTKAIKETIGDDYTLVNWLIPFLITHYPNVLIKRYKLQKKDLYYPDILTTIGHKMNWIEKNNQINENKMYRCIIEDFQKQRLGPISLDIITPQQDMANQVP